MPRSLTSRIILLLMTAAVLLGGCRGQRTTAVRVADPDVAPPPPPTRPTTQEVALRGAILVGDVARVRALLDAEPALAHGSPGAYRTPLAIAAAAGQVEIIRVLIARGADVNARRANSPSNLHHAAARNDRVAVQVLLEAGADPNVLTAAGESPLAIAARGRSLDVVRLLLDHEADPNLRGPRGKMPLMYAAQHDDPAIRDLLLARGADRSIRDRFGVTAADYRAAHQVSTAVWNDDAKRLDDVLRAHPNVVNGVGDSEVPLRRAILFGRTECVRVLIEHGADVNRVVHNDESMLHAAAEFGRTEIARLLIRAGADVNKRDNDGQTPLRYASHAKTITNPHLRVPAPPPDPQGVRRVLLEAKSDVNARDANGRTEAFELADADAVRAFVARGGDIHVRDKSNWTPLRQAALAGQFEVARALLKAGAKLDIISAAAMGDANAVSAMIRKRPALTNLAFENSKRNHLGITPLVGAAMHGRRDVVRILLEHGADPNAGYGGWGMMPLQQAIERDDAEMVELLLKRGARTDVEDAGGGTPLRNATSDRVRELLRRAGAR